MSENRFSDCETARDVLFTFRDIDGDAYASTSTTDALARIAELTPRTVTDDQRTRAISAAIDYRSRPADVLVDRIIDALGWTAAEPERHRCADVADDCCEHTPAPATPAVELERDCENCGGVQCMACRSREHHDECVHDCPVCCIPHGVGCGCWSCLTRAGIKLTEPTPAPVPPAPVVELTAPELESLAGIVRAHERTAIDVGPIAFSLRSVPMVVEDMPERDGAKLDGVSVLRIGGDQ